MTSTTTPDAPSLREALYALSMADCAPDAELLDNVVQQYPQFANELTDFAIELALDALRGEAPADVTEAAVDPSHVSPAVSRAMSRFHNRLHAVRRAAEPTTDRVLTSESATNPFTALEREEFRAFAKRIGANTVFVTKLRDRQIEPETIPDHFRQCVADELSAPLEVVIAHFAATGGSTAARQFYKADDKPSHGKRQTFEEAVRNSGLTAEQQQRLLSL
jgi:hypothetical protein